LVALVSCNKDDDDNQVPESQEYLKVGNSWVYNLEMNTLGISVIGEMKYDVVEKMDDGTFRVIATTIITGLPSQTETYFWTEDDVFDIGRDLSSLSIGDSWDETEDGVTYTTDVVAMNVSVTVPAGTFSCIKLKSTESDNDTEAFGYFDVSYGLIKINGTLEEEDEGVVYIVEMKMELKSKNF
jgi:hypothetical protein